MKLAKFWLLLGLILLAAASFWTQIDFFRRAAPSGEMVVPYVLFGAATTIVTMGASAAAAVFWARGSLGMVVLSVTVLITSGTFEVICLGGSFAYADDLKSAGVQQVETAHSDARAAWQAGVDDATTRRAALQSAAESLDQQIASLTQQLDSLTASKVVTATAPMRAQLAALSARRDEVATEMAGIVAPPPPASETATPGTVQSAGPLHSAARLLAHATGASLELVRARMLIGVGTLQVLWMIALSVMGASMGMAMMAPAPSAALPSPTPAGGATLNCDIPQETAWGEVVAAQPAQHAPQTAYDAGIQRIAQPAAPVAPPVAFVPVIKNDAPAPTPAPQIAQPVVVQATPPAPEPVAPPVVEVVAPVAFAAPEARQAPASPTAQVAEVQQPETGDERTRGLTTGAEIADETAPDDGAEGGGATPRRKAVEYTHFLPAVVEALWDGVTATGLDTKLNARPVVMALAGISQQTFDQCHTWMKGKGMLVRDQQRATRSKCVDKASMLAKVEKELAKMGR